MNEKSDSLPYRRPVEYQKPKECETGEQSPVADEGDVMRRLHDLGYI